MQFTFFVVCPFNIISVSFLILVKAYKDQSIISMISFCFLVFFSTWMWSCFVNKFVL